MCTCDTGVVGTRQCGADRIWEACVCRPPQGDPNRCTPGEKVRCACDGELVTCGDNSRAVCDCTVDGGMFMSEDAGHDDSTDAGNATGADAG
jgi:hypothetical protein